VPRAATSSARGGATYIRVDECPSARLFNPYPNVFSTLRNLLLTRPDGVSVRAGTRQVASIVYSGMVQDAEVKKGDDLGTFKFGGSTVITVWQKGAIQFDPVLVETSQKGTETLVKMGTSLGVGANAPEGSSTVMSTVKAEAAPPAMDEPAAEVPAVEEAPAAEVPAVEEAPAAEVPAVEEAPAAEVPAVAEAPAAEVPAVEEASAAEVPAVEEAPAAEVPAVEEAAAEPAAEEAATAPEPAAEDAAAAPEPAVEEVAAAEPAAEAEAAPEPAAEASAEEVAPAVDP